VTVDGKRVNIPSFLVKPGMTVALGNKSRSLYKFKTVMDNNASRPIPQWLSLDRDKAQASIVQMPAREDIDLPIEEHLIVELYSK
jgi:small subunit ribosomal protein S4